MEEFSEAELQKFQSVDKALSPGSGIILNLLEHFAVMDAQLPDRDERARYLKWSSAVADAEQKIRDDHFRMTDKEFMREFNSVNLLECKPTDRLITFMEDYQDPMPVGFESNIIYRLVPNLSELLPHQDIFQDATDPSLLSPSFLGISTKAQPQEPTPANGQKPNPSETSACNAESDDTNPPGFVFFQLGVLEFAWLKKGKQGWPADDSDEEDNGAKFYWNPANFSLVARVGPGGKADGIYAVHNVFQEDLHVCEERYLVPPHDFRWGMPPTAWGGEYEQFFCAKVGNCLSDFGKRHHMVWTDKIRHRTTELDRVFLNSSENCLDFGKHQQMISTGKIKQAIESDRVPHSGENRLDSDKDHPMVPTGEIRQPTEPDRVPRAKEDRMGSDKYNQMAWVDKIMQPIQSDRVLRATVNERA